MTRRLAVEVSGRRLIVELRGESGRLHAAVDGEPQPVDAVQVGPHRWSLLAGAARASHDVRVRHGRRGAWTVFLNGASVSVTVPGTSRGGGGTADAAAADGPVRLTAPMPGRVVRVLVKPGDIVDARQGLVVVEAMKMENELRAPRPGTIAQVFAREGAPVETGAPLLIIE